MLKIENQARDIDSRAELYKKQLLEENQQKICRLEEKMNKFVKDSMENVEFNLKYEFDKKMDDATQESDKRICKIREQFENNHGKWEEDIFNRIFSEG